MKKILFLFLFVFSVLAFAQKKVTNKVVDAGCVLCIFDEKSDKGCAIGVKMNDVVYPVEGVDEKKLGDPHAHDGYCSMKKKAKISGEIRNGKFYATSFQYVTKPAKKK